MRARERKKQSILIVTLTSRVAGKYESTFFAQKESRKENQDFSYTSGQEGTLPNKMCALMTHKTLKTEKLSIKRECLRDNSIANETNKAYAFGDIEEEEKLGIKDREGK